MKTDYPEYMAGLQKLAGALGKELPGPMAGFAALHKGALADGALGRQFKELIALAIGIAARCGAASPTTRTAPSRRVPPARMCMKPSASPSSWEAGRR